MATPPPPFSQGNTFTPHLAGHVSVKSMSNQAVPAAPQIFKQQQKGKCTHVSTNAAAELTTSLAPANNENSLHI
jgi:hypothetical protein